MGKCIKCNAIITKKRARLCKKCVRCVKCNLFVSNCSIQRKPGQLSRNKKIKSKQHSKNKSSTSSSDLIAMFDKHLELSESLGNGNENSKCSSINDFTSGDDFNYNVETQETNYNLELETEYSDFDSLNDSQNKKVPEICSDEISNKSLSSVEIDISSEESVSIEEIEEQESEEEESEEIENGINLELDSLLIKLELKGIIKMKELGNRTVTTHL